MDATISNPPETVIRGMTPGRLAGLSAIGGVLLPLIANLVFAGNLAQLAGQSVQRIANSVSTYGTQYDAGSFIDQIGQMLFLAFVVIVARRSTDRALSILAITSVAVLVSLDALAVAATFADVQLARHGGDAQSVAALFYVTPGVRAMDNTATLIFGPVFGAVALRGRLLPPLLAWVPIILGFGGFLVQFAAIYFEPAGIGGLLVFVVYLVWLLSTGIYLVARPDRIDARG
jgi:hypothetical protein